MVMVESGKSMGRKPIQTDSDTLLRLRSLVRAFRHVSVSLDLKETIEAILDGARSLIAYDAAGLYIMNDSTAELTGHTLRGYPEDVRQFEPISGGKGIVGHVLETGKPALITDISSDPHYIQARASTQSEVAAPILGTGERLIGVLNLESDHKDAYNSVSLELLELFASGVAIALEKAQLHAETMRQRELEAELTVAREVMESLLPHSVPDLAGLEITAFNRPWREVGGDYFDFIPIGYERWAVTIADVSGKGVPAALIVSALRASLQSLAHNELALRSIFRKANEFFCRSFHSSQKPVTTSFVTLFYAELDLKSRRLIYLNAGHLPPLLFRKDGTVLRLEASGPPLGLFDEPSYQESFVDLNSGEVLALYTDGVTEASDASHELYGIDRLVATLSGFLSQSTSEMSKATIADVEQFASHHKSDDQTLVIIKAV